MSGMIHAKQQVEIAADDKTLLIAGLFAAAGIAGREIAGILAEDHGILQRRHTAGKIDIPPINSADGRPARDGIGAGGIVDRIAELIVKAVLLVEVKTIHIDALQGIPRRKGKIPVCTFGAVVTDPRYRQRGTVNLNGNTGCRGAVAERAAAAAGCGRIAAGCSWRS